jgi:hypothetical protein
LARLLYALLLLVLLLSFVPQVRVRAEVEKADCDALPAVEWQEVRTQAFAILYSSMDREFGNAFSTQYGEKLDAEYTRFEALFETSLSLPISIRIYPTENEYYCLNSQAPEILPGAMHSRIGSREIALIGERISADLAAWLRDFENIFRFELGVLFAEHITHNQALPGLLTAVGHYAQDPAQTIGSLQMHWSDWQNPTNTWRSLWEDPSSQVEFIRKLQATSIVAFLVDKFGWAKFLGFLKSLAASQSYTQSLSQVYGQDFSAIQEEWQEYYPEYFRGRWQTHVIYNYDLSPYQQLVQSEEYLEAEKRLNDTIAFLEKINQADKLNEARLLLDQARMGLDAEMLVLQSRQAVQAGEYQKAIEYLDQAGLKYAQLGNYYHLDELNAYRDQVRKILALHVELDSLRGQAASQEDSFAWETIMLASRLVSLGRRLSALGDVQGYTQARLLAGLVEARLRNQQLLFSLAGIWLILALLGLRIWLSRRKPAPEAEL